MKFWEAILLGSMTTRKARHLFRTVDGTGACAMGAALLAAGVMPAGAPRAGEGAACWTEILRLRDDRKSVLSVDAACPVCGGERPMNEVIAHINNEHDWSRERIALEFVKPIEEAHLLKLARADAARPDADLPCVLDRS